MGRRMHRRVPAFYRDINHGDFAPVLAQIRYSDAQALRQLVEAHSAFFLETLGFQDPSLGQRGCSAEG